VKRAGVARPRVLVAPDAFKGTMRAQEVAAAAAAGLKGAGVDVALCPVADGGEGTMDVLLEALGGERHAARVTDPLGRPIDAEWATLGGERGAIVECAQASGLALLGPSELDAERASSAGTGELLVEATRSGALTILLAVGGTASTDGGSGLLDALEAGGRAGAARLVLLCDVQIPFEAAPSVFGPQKGADAPAVARLERRLSALARSWPRDPTGRAMTGAGGGLAGALWACADAELSSGAQAVLDAVGFERRLAAADAVLVGEGCLDEQSFAGKILGAVTRRAVERALPVHAIVGRCALSAAEERRHGLASVREAGSAEQVERAAGELGATLSEPGSAARRR